MPSAERTLIIVRSPADVFAFFTDPGNDPRWRPSVKEMSASGPLEVGARVHQVVAGPGGRGVPADIEVTAYEPSRRYAFRAVAGPVRPVGEYTFVPNGDATAVTFSLSAEVGGIKKVLLSGPVQKSMDGEMAALDTAKALLEQE